MRGRGAGCYFKHPGITAIAGIDNKTFLGYYEISKFPDVSTAPGQFLSIFHIYD